MPSDDRLSMLVQLRQGQLWTIPPVADIDCPDKTT